MNAYIIQKNNIIFFLTENEIILLFRKHKGHSKDLIKINFTLKNDVMCVPHMKDKDININRELSRIVVLRIKRTFQGSLIYKVNFHIKQENSVVTPTLFIYFLSSNVT